MMEHDAQRSVDATHDLDHGHDALDHDVDSESGSGMGSGPAPYAAMQRQAMSRDLQPLARRVVTPAVALPYQAELEQAFGQSLAGIQVHVGEREALRGLGGVAAADGNVIAFADPKPDRETVAHEVTHVVQARSSRAGSRAGAESEADTVAARVARGEPAGDVTQGATGIHMKEGEPPPPTVDAKGFVRELICVDVDTFAVVRESKAIATHPYAKYLGDADALEMALFGYGSQANALMSPFEDTIGALIAPESLVTLVNRARHANDQGLGPAHYAYMDSVGIALGNALTRRLRESFTRMLPRYVKACDFKPGADGKTMEPTVAPLPLSLTASHPVDRIVAIGLCSNKAKLDAASFAKDHPDVVAAAYNVTGEPITVKFAWERGLWHWVEATPADAKAEHVAKVLFGDEAQAYRLTPMAPLFGFRASDVDAFVPERRKELDELAAAHQPDAAVLNAGEISDYQRDRDERERHRQEEAGYDGDPEHGIMPSGGVPLPPEHDLNEPAPIKGYNNADVDPAVELAKAAGDKYARERAKADGGDGKRHDEKDVHEKLTDCLDVLATIEPSFAALNRSSETLSSFRARFTTRLSNADGACLADPDGEYALAAKQVKLLARIANGSSDTATHLLLYGGAKKTADDALPPLETVPAIARRALDEASEAYATALDSLELPEISEPRVVHAEELSRNLRITVLEDSMDDANPVLQNALDTPEDRHADTASYDPQTKRSENFAIRMRLGMMRTELESDPAKAEKDLAEIEGFAGDYLFEMSVIANLEALDALWRGVNGEHDFWESMGDWAEGKGLEEKNRAYYTALKTRVFEPYDTAVKAKDDKGKKAAKAAFKAIVIDDPEFGKHFERVQSHLKDEASHKKWSKIITGIVIAVVAMGLGQVYFGAILAESGVLAASLGAAAVETTTNAVLGKLILDIDPTAGSLITGFIGAGVMYGMLGRALTMGKAAGVGAEVAQATEKASLLAKAGKVAVNTTRELFLVEAIGLVQSEAANLIDHGTLLNEEQLTEMLIHNVAGLIGMKIGQRIVDVSLDPMAPLRSVGAKHGIDLEGLAAERTKLIEDAKAAEKTKDPATTQELIARERDWVERVEKARNKLLELAKEHPELIASAKLNGLEHMTIPHADAEATQAQAMMSLQQVGPGLYRADAQAFDAILTTHKQSHDQLVSVHTDPVTGVRSMKFQTPDGAVVQIKEKLPEASAERPQPKLAPDEANRFESWLDNEAMLIGEDHRARLREYYARDPRAAIALAGERYGYMSMFTGEHPVTPLVERSPADRAFDQAEYDKVGDPEKTESKITDKEPLDRNDFEKMYEAGYTYDPITREWIAGDHTTAAGGVKLPPSTKTEVVGHALSSKAVGEMVIQKLVSGEHEALGVVGIEADKGFDSTANEWALGRRKSTGEVVLIRGGKGEVNWSQIPDIEDIGHSHPLKDPVTGEAREIRGSGGDGTVDLGRPETFTFNDLLYLMPSAGDLRFVVIRNRPGHKVFTGYVALPDGRISNPIPGQPHDTVDIVIMRSEPIGLAKGTQWVVWKADLVFMAGERRLNEQPIELYSQRIDADMFKADNPSLEPIAVDPLPADHPVLKAKQGATPAGGISDINLVDADTVKNLYDCGLDPTVPENHTLLASLKFGEAAAVKVLADEAVGGRVHADGFKRWLERMKTDRIGALKEGKLAHKELESDPAAQVTFDPDGKVVLTGGRRGTAEIPASTVEIVKTIAGNQAVDAVKPYDLDPTDKAVIADEAKQAAVQAGEAAYTKTLAEADKTPADAKTAAEAASKQAARDTAAAGMDRVETRRATTNVANGSVFGGDFTSQAQLSDFNTGKTGMAAKRLATSLPNLKEADFLAAMAAEVSSGKVPPPRKININGPPPQEMQMWEYADGTEVRYKPLGDANQPNTPTFSLEVKKDATLPDRGADDAAFKVDSSGNARPKSDRDMVNPHDKSKRAAQHGAYEDAVLAPVHFSLK